MLLFDNECLQWLYNFYVCRTGSGLLGLCGRAIARYLGAKRTHLIERVDAANVDCITPIGVQ
jgi:hypothetical protein